MSEWRKYTLEELADDITVGFVGSMASEYIEGGIPFLRSLNVEPLRINQNDIKYISPEFHQRIKKSRLTPGDVVIVRTGKPGACAVVPPWLSDANCSDLVIVRCGSKINNQFLAYYINTVSSGHVASHIVGAVQQHFNVGAARTLPVYLPPLDEQRAIVATLAAFDEKIELNRKMNETLEATARAIFTDWFVDFGPTCAKIAGTKPYLAADIWKLFPDKLDDHDRPEGWSIRPLDEIADFLNGLALQKYPALDNHFLPVIKISQLRATNCHNSDRAAINIPSQYIVEDGDVLFSWSGSLMQRVWTGGRGALNQHLFKVTSNVVPKWFYFYWIDHHMENFRAIAASKATTMGHIQRHHLAQAMTIVPSDQVLELADKTVSSLFERIISNELENRTLAATRDLLLPKLMSGEIRIKDAKTIAKPNLAIAN